MNKEEKKAIEKVKEIIYNPEFRNIILCDSEGFTGWNINFEIILNLIEKQQKEIETLKESQLVLYGDDGNIVGCIRLGNDVISKDKIKKLIKEKAKTDTYNFKTIAVKDIEELLRG